MTQAHSNGRKRYTGPAVELGAAPKPAPAETTTVAEVVSLVQLEDGSGWELRVNGRVAAYGPAESYGWIELVCHMAGAATRAGVTAAEVMAEIVEKRRAHEILRSAAAAEAGRDAPIAQGDAGAP